MPNNPFALSRVQYRGCVVHIRGHRISCQCPVVDPQPSDQSVVEADWLHRLEVLRVREPMLPSHAVPVHAGP